MQKFTNPLDNIRVAKPCSADWNEMFGNERKRFCGDCKLNVYNLSDMTRSQAENFLLESEGRVCVRFFRREDGTMLTKDCPVGLAALKRRVSRAMTAVFSIIAGLFSGLFAFYLLKPAPRPAVVGQIAIQDPLPPPRVAPPVVEVRGKPVVEVKGDIGEAPVNGGLSNLDQIKTELQSERQTRRTYGSGKENARP
jgi:hypothetical protein